MTQPQSLSCPIASNSGDPSIYPLWQDILLLAVIFGGMVWGIGSYGLYEPHEGHFAGVGREMLLSGDWITPNLNGAPYLNKPPLFYWMIATSYALFGINEWAARLPQILIGWSGILITWLWARQLWGPLAGRMAALILTVSSGWYLFSHQLIIDPLLSVIYLGSLYLLWRVTQDVGNAGRWMAFYIGVALSLMAKGLIGPAMLLAAAIAYAVWRRDWHLVKESRPWLGALILLAICGPWLYLMELRNPGFLKYSVVNEHIKRALDTRWPPDYSNVKATIPEFIGITLVWLTPWSLLLPQAISFAWKRARLNPPEGPRAISDALALLLLGLLLPVALFLPMSSRLIYYTLPTVPLFAIPVAGWWSVCHTDCFNPGRRAGGICLATVGAAVFSAGFWVPALLISIPDLKAVPATLDFIPRVAFVLGAALLVSGVLLLQRRTVLSLGFLALLIGLAGAYNTSGFAAFDPVRSSKRMMEQIRDLAGPDCIWISEGSKEIGATAGIAFYLGTDTNGKARQVLIMSDDERRPPPAFPDPQPSYLTTQKKLAEIWSGDTPAVFVTDFSRTDWAKDPPRLPIGECHKLPLEQTGHRHVYANGPAWQRLEKFSIPK